MCSTTTRPTRPRCAEVLPSGGFPRALASLVHLDRDFTPLRAYHSFCMTQRDEPPASGGEGRAQTPGAKKRYEAPKIVHRETIEVAASMCSPSPPAKGHPVTCPSGPVSS